MLNAIMERLGACAKLHRRSLEFGRGMDALEESVVDVRNLLSTLEGLFGSSEKGMAENMKIIIQENIESLNSSLSLMRLSFTIK